MYAVVHPRHANAHSVKSDSVLIAEDLPTIEAAGAARAVSGDVVIDQYTKEVVDSEEWLFEWEKKADSCFAKRAMQDSK